MDATLAFTPAVGDLPFTAEQRSLLSLVHELGPKFAARAAGWDREASFPFANYDDLRDAGLLALCVPKASGGRGADSVPVSAGCSCRRGAGPTALISSPPSLRSACSIRPGCGRGYRWPSGSRS